MIDTGIVEHIALSDSIQHINLIELTDGASPHSHGTSVASLIAGTHENMTGVAPAADLISVRVADETGYSTSFVLAEGIIASVDAGAQLINISLGSEGDSSLVSQAVEYATSQGVAIFASSGNDGLSQAAYPAANADVYSVGAIDANGTHLDFSNTDSNLAFTAPGQEVQAAYPGDNVTSFTGTSASAPFTVGAVAAIISESSTTVTAQQGVEILQEYSNEAGVIGSDSEFGVGIIDVGRAIDRDTTGIQDIAVASQTYLFPTETDATSGVQVVIENRGTEDISRSTVNVTINGSLFPATVPALASAEATVVTIPAGLNVLETTGQLEVSSEIILSTNTADGNTSNDQRTDILTLPE